jgi:putative tryptophan/tyrosine transport system substrate-binding protein
MKNMRRRGLLIAAGAVCLMPTTAIPQQPGRVYRIGWLSATSARFAQPSLDAFREGLRRFGYVEGRNLTIEARWADGNPAALPALARSLVEVKVDVICAQTTPAARAAKQATSTIPIVFNAVAFPDKTGLVASLARPGGNATGSAFLGPEYGKRLELLREVSPSLVSVAIPYPAKNPASVLAVEETQRWARQLGIALQPHGIHSDEDFGTALAAIARDRPDALMTTADPRITSRRKELVAFVVENRLLSVFPIPEIVEAGGLMSYGQSMAAMWDQTALFIDRILKGARPADLPVEQPTKFDLVINLKAAKALALTIPKSMLLRADRVIE